MKMSVHAGFNAFTEKFEGWPKAGIGALMYLDVKGLVSTGIGNLIDPIELALPLPWRKPDGSRASRAEITSAWITVKARQDLKLRSWKNFVGLTDLRLTDDDVRLFVVRRLMENEAILRKRFPEFDTWPADAQLGVLSLAWAAGAYFRFPEFLSAANSFPPDYRTMARESHLDETGPMGAIRHRNRANLILFLNAAIVTERGLDPERLYWPEDLSPAPTPKECA